MIWCLCPKNKHVSPQSIRISTAIGVLSFNEVELSLFGMMYDLGLSPSRQAYQSIVKVSELPGLSLISSEEEEE